jgi:hypothetical protein
MVMLCLCVCVWFRVNYKHRLLSPTLLQCHQRAWYDSEGNLGGGTQQTVQQTVHDMTLKTTWGLGLGKPFFLSFFHSLPNLQKKLFFSQDSCGRCLFFTSAYTLHLHDRVHTNTHLTPTDVTTLHSHNRVHTNTDLTPMDITRLTKSQYATHKKRKKALTRSTLLLFRSSMYQVS